MLHGLAKITQFGSSYELTGVFNLMEGLWSVVQVVAITGLGYRYDASSGSEDNNSDLSLPAYFKLGRCLEQHEISVRIMCGRSAHWHVITKPLPNRLGRIIRRALRKISALVPEHCNKSLHFLGTCLQDTVPPCNPLFPTFFWRRRSSDSIFYPFKRSGNACSTFVPGSARVPNFVVIHKDSPPRLQGYPPNLTNEMQATTAPKIPDRSIRICADRGGTFCDVHA
jgi:hypothetical protein